MEKQSVIILGHGSKSKDAIEDFNYVVKTTREKSEHTNVFGAHMELADPSLEDVIKKISKEGKSKVVILPYFLFNGNHIKEDIPQKIKILKEQYPNLEISFGTPIGKEPMMVELMLRKVKESTLSS